jgi:glycerol kinase
MQFQADLLNVPVIRPNVTETTALGAAYAAGLLLSFWKDLDDLRLNWKEDCRWLPKMNTIKRENLYLNWKRAVERSFSWSQTD